MNKTETTIVVLLFVVLMAWFYFQSIFQAPPQAAPESLPLVPESVEPVDGNPDLTPPVLQTPQVREPTLEPVADEAGERLPEQLAELANSDMRLTLTSWGGAIKSVELSAYRSLLAADSSPVELDFSASPALSYEGIPGLTAGQDFDLAVNDNGLEAEVSRRTAGGLVFRRTIRIEPSGYRVAIMDHFRNASGEVVKLPSSGWVMGAMRLMEQGSSDKVAYLGIDTLADAGGKGVEHWSGKIPAWFGNKGSMLSCRSMPVHGMATSVTERAGTAMAWAAVKNKFFVQILAPAKAASDIEMRAVRKTGPEAAFALDAVSAALMWPEQALAADEIVVREAAYYVGPKLLHAVSQLGQHQDEIMEFGFFKPVCKLLLPLLNGIHQRVGNYGVAIILLTILVKVLFWPITRKSTESMKKMQAIQPEVAAVREKFKDKPEKMNQEVMALYKKHKVNPVSGCLPMLVQIPVFIALFTVLRSAVELRFADFLWIRDLSEPENLLANVLPIPLNILPLLMTVTMVWQQTLTPTGGDPQQKKMMTIMSVVMMFLFYKMASALVLYWTVSQAISIGAILIQRWRQSRVELKPA